MSWSSPRLAFPHKGAFALYTRAYGLGSHIATVDSGVAGKHAERRRVASHLYVSVFEHILVPIEPFRILVEASQRLHLCFHLLFDFPSEVVTRGPVATLTLAQDEQTVPLT